MYSKIATEAIERIDTKIEYLESEKHNAADNAEFLAICNIIQGLKEARDAVLAADFLNRGAQ